MNQREIIRRTIKYLLHALLVSFSAYKIYECSNVRNTIYIGIIAATIFGIIDMISPTITLKY
jgi:hypothetical protein